MTRFAARSGDSLLEREAELERTAELLKAARAGKGQVLAVEGPAGIGKTSLLEGACGLAADNGFRVLRARGGQLEREFPHGVVRQLFESHLRGRPADERASLLEGAAALAAPVVVPDAATVPIPSSADASFSVAHGLYWLAVNLADELPLLLALDDAHWSDLPSLRFLLYLSRRLEGMPLLVMLGIRSGEPSAPEPVVSQLTAEPDTELLRPAPLSEEAVRDLIRTRLAQDPAPEFAAACHRATGGTPFLVCELVSAIRESGVRPTREQSIDVGRIAPETVARSTLLRLGQLPPAAMDLARAIAVLGADAHLNRAARLAGIGLADAVEAVDALVGIKILRPTRPLDFIHPIVRSAVYDDVPAAARAASHSRAADLLMEEAADVDSIAAHLLLTEPGGRSDTVDCLRTAARRAVARGAPESAAAYLRRATAEGPLDAEERAAVLQELGRAELSTFEPGAIEHLEQAFGQSKSLVLRADVLDALARAQLSVGRTADAVASWTQAVDFLVEEDPARALELDAELIALGQMDVLPAATIEARLAAWDVPRDGSTLGERLFLCVLAAQSARTNASAYETLDLARQALAHVDVVRDRPTESPAIAMGMFALVHADALEEADRLARQAIDEARRRGTVIDFVTASAFHSTVACRMGNLSLAVAQGRAAFDAEGLHGALLMPLAAQNLIEALIERGDLDEAQAVLERAGLSDVAATEYPLSDVVCARGRLRVAQGDLRRGLEDLLFGGAMQVRFGQVNPAWTPWRQEAAIAHLLLGEREQAWQLAEECMSLAREYGSTITIGGALRVAGLVQGGAEGLELLSESVTTLDATPARLEHAKALVELGAAHRRANQRAAAREPLRQGLDLAHRCGATRLEERARDELAATGARPRRAMITGRDALTPTEQRIAAMAAEGMSNPEIAQSLFVTRKTIENHLARIYAKLDIHSRERLGEALARADS